VCKEFRYGRLYYDAKEDMLWECVGADSFGAIIFGIGTMHCRFHPKHAKDVMYYIGEI